MCNRHAKLSAAPCWWATESVRVVHDTHTRGCCHCSGLKIGRTLVSCAHGVSCAHVVAAVMRISGVRRDSSVHGRRSHMRARHRVVL